MAVESLAKCMLKEPSSSSAPVGASRRSGKVPCRKKDLKNNVKILLQFCITSLTRMGEANVGEG